MFAKISRRLAGKRWGLYNDDRGIIKVCRTHSKHSNSRLRLDNNTARLHKYSLFMKTKTGFAVQIRRVLYRG